MLANVAHHKGRACRTMLLVPGMPHTGKLMPFIESLDNIYYFPIKSNRLVDDTRGELDYRHVDPLDGNEREVAYG